MSNTTRTVITTSSRPRVTIGGRTYKTQMVVYKTPYGSKGNVTSVTKHEVLFDK